MNISEDADTFGSSFTRGSADAPDTRGKSMVEKHIERQRAEMEAGCLAILRKQFPGTDDGFNRSVLESCGWDVQVAATQVAQFRVATGMSGGQKRGRADAGSDSGSSGSDDDSGSERKRSRKEGKKRKDKDKEKDKKRKKAGKDGKKDKKDKKDKKKEREKEAVGTGGAGGAGAGAIGGQQYGRHGIVRESDMQEKRPEFSAWLAEVQKLDMEALSKWEEKEQWRTYMEDYNTATMPHVKFYDYAAWHAGEQARLAREGGAVKKEVDFSALESDRRRELAGARTVQKEEQQRSLLQHMMLTGKLEGLREQERLRAEMQLAAKLGDTKKVEQIKTRLEPDNPFDSLAMNNYGFRPS